VLTRFIVINEQNALNFCFKRYSFVGVGAKLFFPRTQGTLARPLAPSGGNFWFATSNAGLRNSNLNSNAKGAWHFCRTWNWKFLRI